MPNWPINDYALPQGRGSKTARAPDAASGRTAGGKSPDHPRVLVVEDDFFVSLEIETALTDAGFKVIGPANAAEEAERYAAEERPDLVVMDIRLLSRRDGVEAALAIFRATGIRSIFVTA